MSKTYEITAKQVSQIHNAWVYLNNALSHCDEMFREDSPFVQCLRKSLKELGPVRKDVMDRKDADLMKGYEMSKRIADLNGFKDTIWSIYDVESFLDGSPVPMGSKIRSYYSSKEFTVKVEGPSWIDLWKATDKLVKLTQGDHGDHVFIEGYYKVEGVDGLYEVSLGS
jgi:hypothetical protein